MLRRFFFQQSRLLRQVRCCFSVKTPGLKPNPPPGVFGLYLRDNSEEFRSGNVYLNQSELIRLIGDAWKELPERERQNYRQKYVELVTEYKDDLIAFEDQMKDDQRIVQALKEDHGQALIETEQASRPKPAEYTRPATAFGHFMKVARDAFPLEPSQTVTEWNESMAQKWRNMNEDEKKRFREASRESKSYIAVEKEDKETFSLDEVGGFQR